LYLASAKLGASWPVEVRDTYFAGGREFFQDPSAPEKIAWYSRFGQPGYVGANSMFAAHIDYVGFGKGPFGYINNAAPGDALYLAMDNGTTYTYTVKSVSVIALQDLDMNAVVFPAMGAGVERVTLISCGGTFVPFPGGGGEYTSRVILVAERYVN
jgi:sortase (surface protein transpeptidase)